MATPVRLDEIRAADWQPKLGELGAIVAGAEDVKQCIRIILLTPKGSVPHRPTFGSDVWAYLDWPLDAARPLIIQACADAIARWEPRVVVNRIDVNRAPNDPHVYVTIVGLLVQGGEVAADIEIAP